MCNLMDYCLRVIIVTMGLAGLSSSVGGGLAVSRGSHLTQRTSVVSYNSFGLSCHYQVFDSFAFTYTCIRLLVFLQLASVNVLEYLFFSNM
jgi:hypothetical protein